MRILTAATRLAAIGGLELAQLEACRQLRDRGHHLDLLYTGDGDLSPEWATVAERRIRVSGYALFRGAPLRSSVAVASVIAAVRRLRPDVVYVHHQHHTLSALLGRRPLVCHLHLPPDPSRSLQDELALRRAGGRIAVSRFTAGQWSDVLGLPPQEFTIVANAIDLERFSPADDETRAAIRREMDVPVERFLVLYAGRVDPGKGIDRALDAAGRLDPGEYHLAVAGEPNPGSFGGDEQAARAYADDLRARYRDAPVTWLGRMGDIAPLVAAADAVIVPSRFAEPQGLIVLEALASGTPVVASAVGGIPETLTGELSAGLVPSDGQPADFADRLRALRDWRARDPLLGQRGREHVATNYSLRRMGEAIDDALSGAIQNGRDG